MATHQQQPPPTPPTKPLGIVWLPAFLGALAVGGLAHILTLIGLMLAVSAARSSEGLGMLPVVVVLAGIGFLGFWVGGTVGAYIGLRLRGQPAPIRKAGVFAGISLVIGLVFSPLLSWVGIDRTALVWLTSILLLVTTYVAAAYLSVRIVESLRAR